MADTYDGGPAFPSNHGGGMDLRDYFAAKALAAFIAEPVEGIQESMTFELSDATADAFAEAAYQMADAMLRERAK